MERKNEIYRFSFSFFFASLILLFLFTLRSYIEKIVKYIYCQLSENLHQYLILLKYA